MPPSKSAAGSIFTAGTRQLPPSYINKSMNVPTGDFTYIHHFEDTSEADVYIVESNTTSKRFVIKHTHALRVSDYKDLKTKDTVGHRYPNEVRILLEHIKEQPGIIKVLKVDHDDKDVGRFYILFNYCDAGDLVGQVDYTRHKRRQAIQEPFLLHVLVELTDILAYTHHGLLHVGNGKYITDPDHKSIVHGDVKEDNTFLSWETPEAIKTGLPAVILGDWGAAKVATWKNIKTGPGTWVFHAPEDAAHYVGLDYEEEHNMPAFQQFLDARTTAVDMYALGHIMYKLAGNEAVNRAIGLDPTDLRISREYDTPGLKEVIISLLTIDPLKRGAANFEEGVGLLPKMQEFREARDALLERRGRPDMMDWLVKPPRVPRA